MKKARLFILFFVDIALIALASQTIATEARKTAEVSSSRNEKLDYYATYEACSLLADEQAGAVSWQAIFDKCMAEKGFKNNQKATAEKKK